MPFRRRFRTEQQPEAAAEEMKQSGDQASGSQSGHPLASKLDASDETLAVGNAGTRRLFCSRQLRIKEQNCSDVVQLK